MKTKTIHKTILFTITLIIIFVTLSGCSNTEPELPEVTPEVIPTVNTIDLTTFNDFAINLLKTTRVGPENITISPITIGIAMTMFNIGSLGETQRGISETLNMQFTDVNQVTESASVVMNALIDQQGVWFDNGFTLYVNEGPSIRESFAVRMEDYFKIELNFTNFDEERLEVHINDWTIETTSGRITSIFGEDTLPHDTSTFMLSVSAVDCVWDTAFNPANTRTLPFMKDDGQTLAVPTLRGKMTIDFYEDDDVTVGLLPLTGGKTTLAIFIPPGDDTIEKFLNDFTVEQITLWRALAYEKEKWIYIPKINFATPSVVELSDELSQMGAKAMFNVEEADFTNLGSNFYLDDFYQVSQIRIEETGINESDIDAVDITRANNNGEDFLIINRSFVFALIDEETGGIMMLGTLANPILS